MRHVQVAEGRESRYRAIWLGEATGRPRSISIVLHGHRSLEKGD